MRAPSVMSLRVPQACSPVAIPPDFREMIRVRSAETVWFGRTISIFIGRERFRCAERFITTFPAWFADAWSR